MKKIVVLLTLLASFAVAQAQHIEFKWRGPYVVLDYSYSMTFGHPEASLYPEFATHFAGLTGSVGFQFRRAAAAGVNVSYLSDASGCFNQMPVMLEFRSHLMTSRFTPYLTCGMGYTIPLNNDGGKAFKMKKGGVAAGVTVGGRFAVSRKFGLNLGLSYQLLSMRQVNRYDAIGLCGMEPELLHIAKISAGFNF